LPAPAIAVEEGAAVEPAIIPVEPDPATVTAASTIAPEAVASETVAPEAVEAEAVAASTIAQEAVQPEPEVAPAPPPPPQPAPPAQGTGAPHKGRRPARPHPCAEGAAVAAAAPSDLSRISRAPLHGFPDREREARGPQDDDWPLPSCGQWRFRSGVQRWHAE